jgi:hypothetical protein
MALRLRRGTEAERIITPEQGEIIYVTDTKKVYVGDGATPGGILVGPVDAALYDLVSDTTPQLGGNLDLNGFDIDGGTGSRITADQFIGDFTGNLIGDVIGNVTGLVNDIDIVTLNNQLFL